MRYGPVTFDDEACLKMKEQLEEAYPEEACGLLMGNKKEGRIERIHPAANGARERGLCDSFEIDPLLVYEAEKEAEGSGMEIAGVYHSHPDRPAVPSIRDRNNMIPGLLYLIAGTGKDGVTSFGIYKKAGDEYESLYFGNP